ncbi:AAA family ATPase [Paenibacillus daejeonensis]|uniref:AAA family ATPase n=1 Tax=Paenibacillus daejeonensis TaxID=135193 RepID=UPI00035FE48D|nr:SMC family ATPase [Paenibacillus daejeonensis]
MRPLQLIMTAFGPYKDRETIDFTELQHHRLFVVSGNTGAGKTSIFDAICFALYGDASGEDRNDNRMLRSQFAEDGLHTSVNFTFELKGRAYRVFRQLSHVKAGNKGATGERYELYELDGGEERPLTDRFIVSQVDARLRELIGLTKDQFSQIVMLPQGEFRKLLTSETEDKEEILRRIFKTGLYKVVADRLNEQRKTMQQRCNELNGLREYHIGQVKGTLAGREGSDLHRVLNEQEHYNTHQVLEALAVELAYAAAGQQELQERLKAQTEAYQASAEAFHQAKALNEQFALLERKLEEQRQLAGREQAMLDIKSQLALAERAVHLQVYERQDAEAVETLVRRDGQLEQARQALLQAERVHTEAEQLYKQEEAQAEARELAARELDRLQGYLPIVQGLDHKQRRVAELAAEVGTLSQRAEMARRQRDALEAERTETASQVKALEQRTIRLPELTERVAALREQAKTVRDCVVLSERAEQESQAARELQKAGEQADHAYVALETRWVEGQAGWLASHLHDGESCPVCGSAEHPRKAVLTAEAPTKEDLELSRKAKAAADQRYLEAQANLKATRQQLTEKEVLLREQGFTTDGMRETYAALVSQGKALAEEEKALKADYAGLLPLKQALETLEGRLGEARRGLEQLQQQLHERTSAHATEQALVAQELAALPEEMRQLSLLERRIAETEQTRQRLEAAWKQAQQRYQQASERRVQAAADLSHAERQRAEAAEARERARHSYQQALAEGGFGSEADYRAAKQPDSVREQWQREQEAYQAAVLSVARQVEETSAALETKERLDLDTLQQQLREQEQALEALRGEESQIRQTHARGTALQAEIIEADKRCAEAEDEYQLVRELYDVVRGDNESKMSFERYLQVEFLEKIIAHANERLSRISGGQFYLVRSARLEKRGRQSGLGFDVFDNYTGQLRDVKTLSGGEKFNASLCLALGMADVIQSYEGGISLETMFIDEGFGSLDEESLTKAIDTLVDLQQTGRMIGVISHVQELKQAIPAILEVKKSKDGCSYTRFNIS